ncbi:saccharopine dehydrogenase C-terminal domain-containing protein [Terrimonas rubra]|uniref:Saccharopine dehydrogenase C-terminal domain-containing protein n=1 Tax=Terrimonas rubra TaxID=1035890 RepID=A0ABW6A785_9BACT
MKQILLFGAGKSATVFITYIINNAAKENWMLTIVDASQELALAKIGGSPHGRALSFDITDTEARNKVVSEADIVVSMLPAALHYQVATSCIKYKKHLLTASYVDDAIKEQENTLKENGILFLCEMGLDPGIDHMSAMQLIDDIHAAGGVVQSFKSHCGGLVAPESDNNPWHYKISWNPRNVVLAGKAGAHYLEEGKEIRLPYGQLFNTGNTVSVDGLGKLGWYANRDSLSYATLYGLETAHTFVRTTLRYVDFIDGWRKIVDLGLTDEADKIDTSNKTLAAIWQQLIPAAVIAHASPLFLQQLEHFGYHDSDTVLPAGNYTRADFLQLILETKLALSPGDKDMIVMLHEIDYTDNTGAAKHINSSLIVKGDNSLHTAMAKTVGLPLAIATKYILNGTIQLTGLHIPTIKEIYKPVLEALGKEGILFEETVS